MSNPFIKSMTRLQVPAEMGRNISVGGFNLDADDDGIVEVPAEHVPTLLAHGLKPAPAPAVEAKKK